LARPGETRVPGGKGSAAGYALLIRQPVISHVETETRFSISELVRRSNVRTSANAPIPLAEGKFGVLEVDSMDERECSRDDTDFLRSYANMIGAAVERQRAGSTVRNLMKELQHRVKNDLQIVTAMLTLE